MDRYRLKAAGEGVATVEVSGPEDEAGCPAGEDGIGRSCCDCLLDASHGIEWVGA
jgi:hypothetical protein